MNRNLALLVLCGAVAGCSENFGDVPRIGLRVPAAATPIGPVLARSAAQLTGLPGGLLMATDKGVYRIDLRGAAPSWRGEHPGFVTATGDASPQFLQDLWASPSGERILHNVAVGVGERDHFLFVSADGGRRYVDAQRPSLQARSVDHILASDGAAAFVCVQGVRVYELQGGSWLEWTLPEIPLAIDALGEGPSGEVVLGVQVAAGSRVWVRSGLDFAPAAFDGTLPLAEVAVDGDGRACVVDGEALWRDGERWPLDAGEQLLSGRLSPQGDGSVRYALWTSSGLRAGVVGQALAPASPPPLAAAELRPVIAGATTWLATPGGALLRHDVAGWTDFPLEAPELWFSALGIDRLGSNRLLLGNRNNGRVYRESSAGGWDDLRAYLLNSRAKLVQPDARSGEVLWLGSFGLYQYLLPSGSPNYAWRQRTTGMRSYLLLGSEELMEMSALAFDPDDPDHMWSGATEGNGPYESFDGGLNWAREHVGLGAPGSVTGEDGLPNCSQVRSFVFADGELWMASFRGGVFERSGGGWVQANRGLPDISGTAVDSCCYEALERVVDVRDMLRTQDGSLLASTGFGIYRDRERNGRWEFSGDGLSNFDIFSLAQHPLRDDWILATARGSFDSLDWLFVSTDDGRSWSAVDAGLIGVFATDVEWIEGTRCAVVVDGRGAWLLELSL